MNEKKEKERIKWELFIAEGVLFLIVFFLWQPINALAACAFTLVLIIIWYELPIGRYGSHKKEVKQ
jgi:hypothetical protein